VSRQPRRAAAIACAAQVAAIFATLVSAHAHAAPVGKRDARSLFVPSVRPDVARLAPGWRDAAYLAAVGAAGAVVGANDVTLENRVTANDSPSRRRLARWVQPLGTEALFAAGAAAWSAAWYAGSDPLFASVQRADLSIATAGVLMLGLKQVVGRKRPWESPGDARAFDPFSGHDSFPSGHATLAFAAATALDRETRSRWVPAVAYPLAAAVAWSRVHDRKHWPSDVVAGAALGFGVAWKAEDAMRADAPGSRARLGLDARDGSLGIRVDW
jgi:membrane-associated phospholipid phosphatase